MFKCKSCKPQPRPENRRNIMFVENNQFICPHCHLKTSTKYNLTRHISLKHVSSNDSSGQSCNVNTESFGSMDSTDKINDRNVTSTTSIKEFLESLKLEELLHIFEKERVTLSMLNDMHDEKEIKQCLREIRIQRFGDRQNKKYNK